MSRAVRSLLLMLGALCAVGVSHALIPQQNFSYQFNNVRYSSADGACQAWFATKTTGGNVARWEYKGYRGTNGQSVYCLATGWTSQNTVWINDELLMAVTQTPTCPANSSSVSGGCQCNAGYDESGGQCVPHNNVCTPNAGKVQVTNWTVGFFRTPDDNDFSAVGPVNKLPASGTFCSGGCKMNIPDAGAPGWAAWRSQAPNAQGLYRGSLDIPAVNSGQECTSGAADMPLSPTAVEPQCPGSVGEVNGKLGCYGTAQNPVTTTPSDRPPVTPIAGNPTAGPKPATGEGSGTGSAGRTPSAGNGGNGGGPAAAGVGGKGGGAGGTATGAGTTGTGDQEKPDPCGAPGQPECNVKVNEKGTPEGAGTSYDTAKAKLDETKTKNEEQLAKAAGTGDKGFFEPIRSMFWAPPVAACEPFTLPQQVGGLQLDGCSVVDGVRNAMALVWAGAGLFLCFGMIKRSF